MGLRLGALAAGAVLAACALPAVARASLVPLKPDPKIGATFVGNGGYSADGLGQTAPGGKLQAQVPAGSTVVHAYLYGSYFFRGAVPPADLTLNFDGTNVTLRVLQSIDNNFLHAARADVTAQVAAKVGAGGGTSAFVVRSDPTSLDGLALVVVYSNPKLPVTTVAILDGAASSSGDTATFTFAKPIDPTASGFGATMSLGSGHSYQGMEAGHACGTGFRQSSLIDVNSRRLTSCAGNYDDGVAADGALVTVGGVGDSPNNPTNPNQAPADGSSPRVSDDELYNIKPFLTKGDTQLTISTTNPPQPNQTLGDDLLFLAVISVTGEAGVVTHGGGAPPPAPVFGKSFNAQVRSGKVLCRPRGSRTFTPLTKTSQLQMGSECDATRGVIRITSAVGPAKAAHRAGAPPPPTQFSDFMSGQFVVTQKRAKVPYTDVALSGGDFKHKCGRKHHGVNGALAADPKVRRLWGHGKGNFRTKGRYSSAAVRGTQWLTEDHCHSTVTKVKQGKVLVTDNVRHRQVTVTAGHTYVAKAPGRQQKGAAGTRRMSPFRSWLRWLWSMR